MCALTQVAMIAASCTPPAPVLILSWSVVVVVVGVACCCCIPLRLALMLVLTFASCTLTFAPCTLTFAPCACGGCHWQQLTVVVFLPQPLAQVPHLHTWWFHPLQLVLVVFILPPTGEDTGGFTHCYLRWWCLSFHPLAQILVVSPIATCAGGVYPSTHWRRYCTCTQATCTVWWCFFSGGGGGGGSRCMCMWRWWLWLWGGGGG